VLRDRSDSGGVVIVRGAHFHIVNVLRVVR
jgi:hypothetical protein